MTVENSLDGINKKLAVTAGYTERIESALSAIGSGTGAVKNAIAGLNGVGNSTGGVGGGKPLGGGAAMPGQAGTSGARNSMSGSLGSFSAQPVDARGTTTPTSGGSGGGARVATPVPASGGGGNGSGRNLLTGALAVGGGAANAAWQMTPGVRDAAAYQAALFPTAFAMSGPYSNARARNLIMSGIGNGSSGVNDPLAASALATSIGFGPNLGGGSTMKTLLGAASFSYQMTGMNNAASMSGMTSMYRGTGGATNRLQRIGIFSADMRTGMAKDPMQIVDELWARFYGSKSKKITMEQFEGDLAMGFLGSELSALFGDSPELYSQIVEMMRVKAKAGGRAGMRASGGGSNNLASVAKGLGMTQYNTPTIKAGEVNAARLGSVASAADSGLMNSYVNSGDVLVKYNEALTNATTSLGDFAGALYNIKGFMDVIGGSELSPLLGIAGGALKLIPGLATGGVSGRGTSTSDSIPAMLSKGEYVINARAAQAIGMGNLNALNNMGKGFGSAFASPTRNFNSGGTTLSGHAALQQGDPRLESFNVPGVGRSITAADSAGPLFQAFLADWQSDPLLGGGRFNLKSGRLESYNHRKARAANALSDHAGYAIDVRPDILRADNKQHMTAEEQSAVRQLLSRHSKIGWGGDYKTLIDEMHFYVRDGQATGGGTTSDSSSRTWPSDDTGIPLGESESLFQVSMTGADAVRRGISGLAYSSTESTSLSSLGKSGRPLGSFTQGFVSASNISSNAATVSIFHSSVKDGVSSEESSDSSLGTRSSSAYGKPPHIISGPNSASRAAFSDKDIQTFISRANKKKKAFAKSILQGIGASSSDVALAGMLEWMRYEGGHFNNRAKYNPLNTTKSMDGNDPSMNSHGVRMYDSWSEGTSATLKTLQLDKYGYPEIVKAFQQGSDLRQIFSSINSSKWGTKSLPGYSAGTPYVSSDQLAYLHQGETVIPAQATPDFRRALHELMNGGGKGRSVTINLNIERASDEEAERFARKVKQMLENDSRMERMRTK